MLIKSRYLSPLLNIDGNSLVAPNLLGANDDLHAICIFLRQYENKNTFQLYSSIVERFYNWLNHNETSLQKITLKTIEGYKCFLADPHPKELWCGPPKPRGHSDWKPFVGGLSVNSRILHLNIIHAMMEYLYHGGYIQRNPFRIAKKLKAQQTKFDKYS